MGRCQAHSDKHKFSKILILLKSLTFITGNRYCPLFSLKWLTLSKFEIMSTKYSSLSHHSLSVILSGKKGAKLVHNPNNHTCTFPQDNHHTLICREGIYEYLPFLRIQISKRCVFKGQNLIELKCFTSSKILSEASCFFFPACAWCNARIQGYDYSVYNMCQWQCYPPVLLHHRCKCQLQSKGQMIP